jgi:hypothetical protein
MAEFQWWLLIVGLVAGGGLVAVVTMDGRRRDEDLGELERRAEANWISERLSARGRDRSVEPRAVESILRAHREYLSLPPPDELVVRLADDELDRDPNEMPDQVRDDGRRSADEDLART